MPSARHTMPWVSGYTQHPKQPIISNSSNNNNTNSADTKSVLALGLPHQGARGGKGRDPARAAAVDLRREADVSPPHTHTGRSRGTRTTGADGGPFCARSGRTTRWRRSTVSRAGRRCIWCWRCGAGFREKGRRGGTVPLMGDGRDGEVTRDPVTTT